MWGLGASLLRLVAGHLWAVFLLATAPSLAAQDEVVLTDGRESYPLGLNLEILEEREKA